MSTSTLPAIPFFQRALATAEAAPDKVALVDGRTGQERTYGDLLRDVVAFRQTLNPDGRCVLKLRDACHALFAPSRTSGLT